MYIYIYICIYIYIYIISNYIAGKLIIEMVYLKNRMKSNKVSREIILDVIYQLSPLTLNLQLHSFRDVIGANNVFVMT